MRFARTYIQTFLSLASLLSTSSLLSSSSQQALPPSTRDSAPLSAPKDTQAVAAAQWALAAMGAQNLAPLATVSATGTLTLQGDSALTFPVLYKSRGARQMRMELTTNKGIRLFTVNDKHGIIRYPDGSVRKLLDDNMAVQRVDYIPVLSLLSELARSDVASEYLGDTNLGNAPVHLIALSLYSGMSKEEAQRLQDRTRVLYYINAESGLVSKTDRTSYSENYPTESEKLETYFSDYRLLNGVQIPFHQQTFVNGKPYLDLALSGVSFNASVQDSDFSID